MTVTRALTGSVGEPTLYVAFELGATTWTLGLTSGFNASPWVKGVPSGDWMAVRRLIERAKRRFGLPETAAVVSCYEAGRDGFWIHRALVRAGISNRVVDSASIEVSRRRRRAKTDRIDARKLVHLLVRVCLGEREVWREVQERTRLVNQLRSWLATYGARLPRHRGAAWWTRVRDWAERPLPAEVQARLARAEARLAVVEAQLADLTKAQRQAARLATVDSPLGRLVRIKGVAATGASVLLEEGLVWRAFRNRREVGGMLGFGPVPYQSGAEARDQGIDRAGNMRWRAMSIQLAWRWVRWQPSSALTQWYQQRFADRGPRARRIGIVAVARKLLIALWRYATTGVVPMGTLVKVA